MSVIFISFEISALYLSKIIAFDFLLYFFAVISEIVSEMV